ncbi:MAG TPA: DUF3891 family protein [Candidatus Acidoferrales bacterium]|nr:DUF3891 family protein [Candidatus Acidoferrales bacterium]
MIVAEGPSQYRLISQNDHGDLAGQFAAHWGNDKFARLKPYESMVLAAEAHDNGWWNWDINPSVDENGVPLTFSRTPREFRSDFYGKGIDSVIARDLYAGLIVSLHGVGLPQQRYGTMTSMVNRVDEYSLRFIKEREPTHKVMMEQVARMEQYAGMNSEEQIWFNYRMMQVFDRLSLFFCANFDISGVGKSGFHSTTGKVFYGSSMKPTPTKFGQEDSEVRLRVTDKKKVVAEPYPFDEPQFTVSVRGRLIPKRAYKSQEDFRTTYAKTNRELFEFTVAAA